MTRTITDALYYHINSNANGSPHLLMQPGDVLEIGLQTNPFFHFYEAFQRTYPVTDSTTGQVIRVPAIKFLSSVNDGSVASDALPKIAVETAKHFLMLSRELLWENVRLAEFPNAPSRQRCVWLIETLDDVQRWLVAIGFAGNCAIVKIRATGQVLRVDGNQLPGDSEPLPDWYERARAYWNGQETDNPLPEVLFEGTLRVEELVDMSSRSD